MILSKLIEFVDSLKPNTFPPETKVVWVNEIEGMIQTEVHLLAVADVVQYSWPENQEAELIVPPPYDKLYRYYLESMIAYEQEEMDRYANAKDMFQKCYIEYVGYVATTMHPGDGCAERAQYYLSAYGLAVKLGYTGTEEEWLKSLQGAKGDPFRYEDFTVEQLMQLTMGIQDYVVAETKAEVEQAAQDAADRVQSQVEEDSLAAQQAADRAEAAEEAARASQTAAKQSENTAKSNASSASQSMSMAASYESSAEKSAEAAKASETNAKASEEAAEKSAEDAGNQTGAAAGYAQSAQEKANQARASADMAKSSATESQSWAVGGTGSRQGEDSDNAKYWADSAKSSESTVSNLAQQANKSRVEAESFAANAKTSETAAAQSARSAQSSASTASMHAGTAQGQATAAFNQAKLSQSWAVGGTGSRPDEDSNNAKYWAEVAQSAAESGGGGGGTAGVTSFNGRTGAVKPQAGDYTAEQVKALSTAGGSLSGNLVMQGNKIQAVGYPQSSTDAANKGYVDGTVKTFKGRTGDVVPQSGDYTAEMVGALPSEVLMLTGFEPDPVNPDSFSMKLQLTDEQYEAVYDAMRTGRPINFEGHIMTFPIGDASDHPVFATGLDDGSGWILSVDANKKIATARPQVLSTTPDDIGSFDSLDVPKTGADSVKFDYQYNLPLLVIYAGTNWILYPESNTGNIYVFSNGKYRLTADTDANTITLSENEVYSMIGNLNMILDTINGEVV